jgi:hypothetical protein
MYLIRNIPMKKIIIPLVMGIGALQWRNRSAPCPIDTALRDARLKTRKTTGTVYVASVVLYLIGGWFAFIQPWLSE